jgi:hypothetical protein
MGGDCSDAIKVWYPSNDIIKDLSKKKNRQKEHKMTLPNKETQNYQIKRISRVGRYVVYEPVGEVNTNTEAGIGRSDPYMGV